MILDKESVAYWTQIEAGDMICLSDPQSIEDSGNPEGLTMEVTRVKTIKDQDDLVTWLLITMVQMEETLYLLVKVVDDNIDLGVYFEETDISGMNRDDLINEDLAFLFEEFDIDELEQASDLEMAKTIFNCELEFNQKPQGVLYGESSEKPKRSGCDDSEFTIITEYQSAEDTDNPHMLVLEEGGEECPAGGLITVYSGASQSMLDVDIFKQ